MFLKGGMEGAVVRLLYGGINRELYKYNPIRFAILPRIHPGIESTDEYFLCSKVTVKNKVSRSGFNIIHPP